MKAKVTKRVIIGIVSILLLAYIVPVVAKDVMIRVYDYKIAKQKKRRNYCEEVQKQATQRADELREKRAEVLGTGFQKLQQELKLPGQETTLSGLEQ